jgi:hypothetical protein
MARFYTAGLKCCGEAGVPDTRAFREMGGSHLPQALENPQGTKIFSGLERSDNKHPQFFCGAADLRAEPPASVARESPGDENL